MLENMEKGDFSIFRYTALDGADAFYQSNQEFTGDAEIGSLLRTQDFRVAMSLAWDRNAGNEIALSGLGTPQNNDPHPDTPYAAEDKYRYQDVERNVAKSKQLLAKLGLTTQDGLLMRKDGGGQLSLFHQSGATYFPMMELLQNDLKDVGIAVSIKEGSARAGMTADDITEYYEWWTTTEGGTNPWGNIWNANAPTHPANGSPGMGKYFETRGESGMAPTGPDPKYTDAYGNMAPDGTYPADITGKLQELQNLWSDGNVRDLYDPARIEMGKDIYRISGEWHFNTNMTGFSGISRALSVKRNNVRNHARNGITGTGQPTDQLYFERGVDNVNNPGNRSREYKSVSFLMAEYWNPVLGK
jgi:ABC-type transport system substrate-binding protein